MQKLHIMCLAGGWFWNGKIRRGRFPWWITPNPPCQVDCTWGNATITLCWPHINVGSKFQWLLYYQWCVEFWVCHVWNMESWTQTLWRLHQLSSKTPTCPLAIKLCFHTLKLVEVGIRLSPPPGCPRPIYSLMMQCWYKSLFSSFLLFVSQASV